MPKNKLIAVDLAKSVFQVCHLSSHNKVEINKTLRRSQLVEHMANQEPSVVAMEACYSSHFWGRTFESMGHEVHLLPAQHVKPFVQGNKTDHNDALAIAEAAQRPNIRPVPIKTIERQAIQSLHRIRDRYIRNRTSLINQTRGIFSEFGLIAPKGVCAFTKMLSEIRHSKPDAVPTMLQRHLDLIFQEYTLLCENIEGLNSELKQLADRNSLCKLLMTIPGIGYINATALYSAIGDASQFSNGRELSVWLGVTPRVSSSGERSVSHGMSKRGNHYLRKQLIHGARAMTCRAKNSNTPLLKWASEIVSRRGKNKAYVAVAHKLARIIWAVLHKRVAYRSAPLIAL